MNPYDKWDDCDITFMIIMTVYQRKIECIKCTTKRDELYDVPTRCMTFLKYDLFLHSIEDVCYV
jgi:hypothetical protein